MWRRMNGGKGRLRVSVAELGSLAQMSSVGQDVRMIRRCVVLYSSLSSWLLFKCYSITDEWGKTECRYSGRWDRYGSYVLRECLLLAGSNLLEHINPPYLVSASKSSSTRTEDRLKAFITALTKYPDQSYQQLLVNIREEMRGRYTQQPQLSACHRE